APFRTSFQRVKGHPPLKPLCKKSRLHRATAKIVQDKMAPPRNCSSSFFSSSVGNCHSKHTASCSFRLPHKYYNRWKRRWLFTVRTVFLIFSSSFLTKITTTLAQEQVDHAAEQGVDNNLSPAEQDDDGRTQPPSPQKQHFFLCVFIPVTKKSKKDVELSKVQLKTWMTSHKRHDVRAFFIGEVLSEEHRSRTISIIGDDELPYDQLPVRTFKMWTYLGLGDWKLLARKNRFQLEEDEAEEHARVLKEYNRTGYQRYKSRTLWSNFHGEVLDSGNPSSSATATQGGDHTSSATAPPVNDQHAATVHYGGRVRGREKIFNGSRTKSKAGPAGTSADVDMDREDSSIVDDTSSSRPASTTTATNLWNSSPNKMNPGTLDADEDEDDHAFYLDDNNLVEHTAVDTERYHLWSPAFSDQVTCDYYMKADPDSYVNVPAVVDRLQCFASDFSEKDSGDDEAVVRFEAQKDEAAAASSSTDANNNLEQQISTTYDDESTRTNYPVQVQNKQYFGVVHAVAPDEHTALFFGHGGSGYMINYNLLHDNVAQWSINCLSELIKTSNGVGMEDVLFSRCLRDESDKKIGVLSYGHTYTEFILNFHQAERYILNGTRLLHGVDLLPPPLSKCTLVAHPIEKPQDLVLTHKRITDDFSKQQKHLIDSRASRSLVPPHILIEENDDSCFLQPFLISKQAEVRISKGSESQFNWSKPQMKQLYECYLKVKNNKEGLNYATGSSSTLACEWTAIENEKYYGLKHAPYADDSYKNCKLACCESFSCAIFLFRERDGCWLGHHEIVEKGKSVFEPQWRGGMKARLTRSLPVMLTRKLRNLSLVGREDGSGSDSSAGSRAEQVPAASGSTSLRTQKQVDSILDFYIDDMRFRNYANMLLKQDELSLNDFHRRIWNRFEMHMQMENGGLGMQGRAQMYEKKYNLQ
ncbi:unnamed protein product, partial [Amoebophrya sp. A120]